MNTAGSYFMLTNSKPAKVDKSLNKSKLDESNGTNDKTVKELKKEIKQLREERKAYQQQLKG